MEIHSSSLSTPYAGTQTKNTNNEQPASTKENQGGTQLTQAVLLTHSNEIEDNINKLDFQHLIEPRGQLNSPTNFNAARALKAYTQEDTLQLKTQPSKLKSSIDFFA